MQSFSKLVSTYNKAGLNAARITTVQVNMGLRCNLSCAHCHLGANSSRTEEMSWETMQLILDRVAARMGLTFDLTGGSPELNPHLERFIKALTAMGQKVLVRTNLAVLASKGLQHMVRFYRKYNVDIVASLPCYMEENVDAQRGNGTFLASLAALKELNSLGYGTPNGPMLDLVFNPAGPMLPPDQMALEAAYKKELAERYGVFFSRLFTITNMPIGRFIEQLENSGEATAYTDLLMHSFNPDTITGLMCRHQICVRWDGVLSDCDFNQALELTTAPSAPSRIEDFEWSRIDNRPLVFDQHCFGCTAGSGSSCGGALVDDSDEVACAAG
jgi:radical SAM/Cys-rich protein